MSGWNPGGGRDDEVSFGPARSSWASGRAGFLLVSVLTAGLLVGGLLGAAVGGEQELPPREPEEPVVVAGSIEGLDHADENGPVFALHVRNGGDETVEVDGLRFDELGSELEAVEHASLPPGTWSSVTFSAPADCAFDVPATLDSVSLTLRTPEGGREQEVPVADGGRSLLDYHAAVCAPQVMPRPQDLAGVWVVEEAFGMQDWVGIMVWRLGRDGSFDADPEGLALLDVTHGVEGRYSLAQGEMRVEVDGGYGCSPGDVAVWRPSLVDGAYTAPEEQPRLTLAWVEGRCPDDMAGQVWTLRRVLDGATG